MVTQIVNKVEYDPGLCNNLPCSLDYNTYSFDPYMAIFSQPDTLRLNGHFSM